jgi:predicted nucleic acid-binding Zn ribbon protein
VVLSISRKGSILMLSCLVCGVLFEPRSYHAKYCSEFCREKAKKMRRRERELNHHLVGRVDIEEYG